MNEIFYNVAIVRQCQELFGFQLPSITLCKRVDKFVGKYYASDNLLCKICSKFVEVVCSLSFTVGVIICVTLMLFICTVC